MTPRIRVLPSVQELAAAVAEYIVELAHRCIEEQDSFSLALCGGTTPLPVYQLLADNDWVEQIDWAKVQVYFGDERCVPPEHPDSNFHQACQSLLDRVPIAPNQIHRMKGELEPRLAADEYEQLLRKDFPDRGLDLALLGIGTDGHTASLFPGTAALEERQRWCVANHVPGLGVWRLTLTACFLNRSRQVVVMATGSAKAQPVQQALEGPYDPQVVPIQLIDPASGAVQWYLDAEAAGMR